MLLLKGDIDLECMRTTSWPLHYVAQPASNSCSVLIRRCVSIFDSCQKGIFATLFHAHWQMRRLNFKHVSDLQACHCLQDDPALESCITSDKKQHAHSLQGCYATMTCMLGASITELPQMHCALHLTKFWLRRQACQSGYTCYSIVCFSGESKDFAVTSQAIHKLIACRVASCEELLPINHLISGQAPEVPPHVRAQMQSALQAAPLVDFSPLQQESGCLRKVAVSAPCCFHQPKGILDHCCWQEGLRLLLRVRVRFQIPHQLVVKLGRNSMGAAWQ